MARLVSSSIQNLLNGVSQQPDTVRLPNQAATQENGLSDVVFGLGKRPSTEHVAKLSTATDTNVKVHLINRDSVEQYVVLITNGGLKVYTLGGVEKTVVAPSGLSYLTTTTPNTDINCITVADYTFMVNKGTTIAKSGSTAASRPAEAIFYVKNGQYKTTYEIKIDGSTQASYQTLDNSSAGNASSITTDNIATELYNDLVAALTGYTIERDGSIIYLSKTSGTFTAGVTDGLGGDGLIQLKDKTQNFSDLPYKGRTDFLIEITGDGGTEFDNYFVKWDGSAWVETVKGGLDNSFDPTTMPFVLIRTSDGNFRFTPCDGGTYTIGGTSYDDPEWGDRAVGDIVTNPDPSFIGTKINDIFFYRNRLGFCADENVVFSKAGEFFDFYYTTVTTTQDDDPVDISVSHNKVSILKYGVPFNEELILFSDQSQFILKPEETLTAKTVSINQATEYEISDTAKPFGIGQNIYFGFTRGSFSGVKEYYVSSDTEVKDATDTTINLPRYMTGNIFSLKGSSTENTLFALSDENRNQLYVYKFYFDANQKALQRSWSTYILDTSDVILDIDTIQNFAWLVIKRDDGTYLEKMNMKSNEAETNLDFPILLDRKTTATGVYASGTDLTTWTMPYPDKTFATCTITVSDAANIAVGSTITITDNAGVSTTMTATNSDPAPALEFSVGGSRTNDDVADNIAVGSGGVLGINALAGYSAPNPAGGTPVITVTRAVAGGNNLTVTSSDTTRLAVTNFTGGTGVMEVVYNGSWPVTQKGRNVTITQASNTSITALGDHSAYPCFLGRKYNFKYEFSKFYTREQKATGTSTTINTGRLQLKHIGLIFGDTGYFEVTVAPKARTSGVYKFTGQILGSSSFVLGTPSLDSGDLKVPIQCRNQDVTIDIQNNTYLPCNFLSAEWTGIFSILSARMIA